MLNLVEWVGSGAPVGQEHAEADGFEKAGQDAHGHSVERSVLDDKGGNELH